MKTLRNFVLALVFAVTSCDGAGTPIDVEKAESSLLTAWNVGPYIWATGQVNDTTAARYVCSNPPLPVYWFMYVNIAQSIDGFPVPQTIPQNWHTRVFNSDAYLNSDHTRALSTLDCPPVAMTYSPTYGVIYNTAQLNCTVRGHVPNGPTKSQAVVIDTYNLQYVPGYGNYGYWVVYMSHVGTSYINGTGYCGPTTKVFGS